MTTPSPTAAPGLLRSRRAAARALGLTEGALRCAEKAGRIAPEPGGGYDLDRLRAGLRSTADPARAASGTGPSVPGGEAPALARPVPPAAVGTADVDPPRERGLAAPRPGAGTTFADARTAHEILKAQERRLRLDERRGRLVDRARALLLVRRLAQEERDAILAWPARAAAVLAAELGVDPHRLQTVLDRGLRRHLTERRDGGIDLG